MLFEIDSFAGPKIDLFITLSQNKPVYLMDTKFVTSALIYVSDNLKSQNYTITVTSNLKYSADVFNNQSLTTSLLGPKW
uniref:Uncharacterized protein n=1 Tax=Panagrolaimus sp. PS1159 TaxID=55785 RepID=A0AC35GVG2_9BILA